MIAPLVGLVISPVPAQAQFRGLLPSVTRDAVTDAQSSDSGCAEGQKKSTAGKVLGGMLGRMARGAAGRAGITRWVPVDAFTDQLSESIACRLDPEEQQKAAEATLAATGSVDDAEDAAPIEPARVGSSASWQSATREDVSGTSTVTARVASVGDADCITVTDVVIVRGEETTADKRMCRPPGQRRYSIVA
ncbi:hypothetical protein [Qipengyuania sp. MTN3-11]|uniref:hypothetical protein n=1 Tax=Qipengyuania sp. MTN3-11 TaxID=3056557 RepID=UPI0036F1E31D